MDTVHHQAADILLIPDPYEKCDAILALCKECISGNISIADSRPLDIQWIETPGRPLYPELIRPAKLPKRSLHTEDGRMIFMHAIAHIEFNAINLACDAVYRFYGLPRQYYLDWLSVAADEARHYRLIIEYLGQRGCHYGDYAAHDGLWDMAMKTQHDVIARMALVPRVLEARGLDVTPAMIEKLRKAGDHAAANVLKVIYEEEIRHVELGSYWFRYLCEQRDINAEETFFDLLDVHFAGELRGPFNLAARMQAGFSQVELSRLNREPDR